MRYVWPVTVSAVRMLVVLSRTPGMFIQDRDMYTDRSQELITWAGVSHFNEIAVLNLLVCRVEGGRESVTEVLLERGGLCCKREDQVLACGRGRSLVWVDSRKQCHVDLVCVATQGSARESRTPFCN